MTTSLQKLFHFLFFIIILFFLPLFISSTDPLGNHCNNNTTTNGQLSANINHVLSDLVSRASINGFATTSAGTDVGTRVFGLAQCRGDVSAGDCKSCLADATLQLPKLCPNRTDARIWYDYCFLRYDTTAFAGELDTGVGIFYYNIENVTDPKKFDGELGALMEKVRSQAVALPASRGLGKGKTKLSPFETIYALVQCTEDLSPLSCAQCLAVAESEFSSVCFHRKGCRVLYSSCYVRYELYPFFFPLDKRTKFQGGVDASTTSMVVVHPDHL